MDFESPLRFPFEVTKTSSVSSGRMSDGSSAQMRGNR